MNPLVCTRRRALLMGGAFAAAGPVAAFAEALPRGAAPDATADATALSHAGASLARGARLYAVVRGGSEAQTGVAGFVWSGEAWQRQQFVHAPAAGLLLVHPERRRMLLTHAAEDARHPAGFVEALHMEEKTGVFTRGRRQPLALSARIPIAMALSPDRRMLAVAAAGGVLSLLPVRDNGEVGEVIAAHKHLASVHAGDAPTHMAFASNAELHVYGANQALRFDCAEGALHCVGSADVQTPLPVQAAYPLPEGVVSSVLLPALPLS